MSREFSKATHPHIHAAHHYALEVVAGEVVAGKWVRLACARYLADLKREDLTYRLEEAERACKFVELMPHIKGKWAKRRETIKLEPWQCFILCNVFGWYGDDGLRRFRYVYEELGRKNAKTTLVAAVALYAGFCEGEAGAETYSAAVKFDQAKIAFQLAQAMARKTEGFRQKYGVEVLAHNISALATDSKFEALSSDSKSLDGLNLSFGIVDELHAHKDRSVYDVLKTAMGSRDQPILWAVTTAGTNTAGVCYQERMHVTKVLENVVEDDSYFGIIYTLDEGDDWQAPELWIKANPNLGVSVNLRQLEDECIQAKSEPAKLSAFLTKHMSVWTSARSPWMNMGAWNACGDESLSIDDFEGVPVWLGLDLAWSDDVAALLRIFDRDGELYVFGDYYLPRDVVQEKAGTIHSHYASWAERGLFTLTDGNTTDEERIKADILEDGERFDVRAFGYDPWQTKPLATSLMNEHGLPAVKVPATVGSFSQPMKTVLGWVKSGKLHHDGNPVLTWMVSNTVCKLDAKDNIYPRKERPEDKIDGLVALVIAANRYLDSPGAIAGYNSGRQLVVI